MSNMERYCECGALLSNHKNVKHCPKCAPKYRLNFRGRKHTLETRAKEKRMGDLANKVDKLELEYVLLLGFAKEIIAELNKSGGKVSVALMTDWNKRFFTQFGVSAVVIEQTMVQPTPKLAHSVIPPEMLQIPEAKRTLWSLDTPFEFGKYWDKVNKVSRSTIETAIRKDINYVHWLINNNDWFRLDATAYALYVKLKPATHNLPDEEMERDWNRSDHE